jgi:hypothetical protein
MFKKYIIFSKNSREFLGFGGHFDFSQIMCNNFAIISITNRGY